MTTTDTTHADLTALTHHWDDLRDMLDTPTIANWPPSGLNAYLAALDDDAREQYRAEQATEHAERTATAMGERPVPLRLAILDTITALDAALLHLTDQIAASVQRPAAAVRKSAGPADEIGRQLRLAAAKDEADLRRWRWNGTHRDGRTAAVWLLGRIGNQPGPFRDLLPGERLRIGSVAAGARRRMDAALGLGRREDPIARRCPCGGPMVMRQGGVLDPEVECQACEIRWIGPQLVQLLDAA